jgi:CDP-diacylglycerol--glycerol-3-phosphate 3-phosphatidyltransferase
MRITANQVTGMRLVLIPIPCWLMYQGVRGQFAALVLATLLGCTDFIDGYLARKHGATVLGGLMDPIADKVFIAITFLPAVDLGWVPPWMVAALFVREFVVTALRSSYERRGQSLKSTYLARYKTWAQMCGIGVLMLLNTVSLSTMRVLLAAGAALPLVFFLVRWLAVRRSWKGASAFAASFAVLLAVLELGGTRATADALMWFILGVTWVSGLGYFVGFGLLRGRGRASVGELVRILGAAALPCLAVLVQVAAREPAWTLIALVSFELAHGGLDNLLAHHRADAGALSWGARVGAECALLVFALAAPSADAAARACVGAVTVAAVGLVVAFIHKRRYYLDPPPTGMVSALAPGVAASRQLSH